jgi:hypothetical protein
VIHAVGKQVSPQRLIEEGNWAMNVYQETQLWDDLNVQIKIVEAAHLAKLNSNPKHYYQLVHAQLPYARDSYDRMLKDYAKKRSQNPRDYRRGSTIDSAELIARRRAAQILSGDRAHQMFAAEPAPLFSQIRKRAFEKLTGEKFSDSRNTVYLAAQGFEKARERDMPVLLVLYKGHGKDRNKYDARTEQLINDVFRKRPVSLPLQSFVVVTLPVRELAALSNLADTPNYELANRATPSLIITDPAGKQITAINGSINPMAMAMQLWPSLNQVMLARAESRANDGEIPDAIKILRGVLKTTTDESVTRIVNSRLNEMMMDLAEKWAEDGRTMNALRMFRKVELASIDEPLRERAGQRIASIRSQL